MFRNRFPLLLFLVPVVFGLSSCNSVTNGTVGDLVRVGSSVMSAYGNTYGRNTRGAVNGLTAGEVSSAFKQALSIGVGDVVDRLGVRGGFNLDPKVHIPLPEKMRTVQSFLKKAGMSYVLDDLENRMNEAAEAAVPHVRELFLSAVSDMTFEDVWSIYNGGGDSATRYFRAKMSDALAERMRPIVSSAVARAGVVSSYERVMESYSQIPFVPDVRVDLTDYVLQKGIDGMFYYLALEEKEIRANPVRHTTELLKKVFGHR